MKLAGEVKGWDPETVIDKKEVRRMDRFAQLALGAAVEAMAMSGLEMEREDSSRCGVLVSSGVGGFGTMESEHTKGEEKGFDRVSPFFIPMVISNMAAGHIAIRFGFRGMCSCPVTACASGSNAIGDAFRQIRDGYAEVMLCGGAEATVTPFAVGGFTSLKALCTGEDPERASIPFDKERSGFVMGEGAGILVLEEYEHARARGRQSMGRLPAMGPTATPITSRLPLRTAREQRPVCAPHWRMRASRRSKWITSTPTEPLPLLTTPAKRRRLRPLSGIMPAG